MRPEPDDGRGFDFLLWLVVLVLITAVIIFATLLWA